MIRGSKGHAAKETVFCKNRSEIKFELEISTKLRNQVLEGESLFCSMCGVIPGDVDEYTNREAIFRVSHVKDMNLGGKDELMNLRALCSTCNQGAKNITSQKPSAIWLLSQVRRAGQDEQRAVLAMLLKKFGQGT